MANPVGLMIVHDDWFHLYAALMSLGDLPKILVVNKLPFRGQPGDWQKCVTIGESAKAEVHLVELRGEKAHRNAALQIAREHPADYSHSIVNDSDEILERLLLGNLLRLADADLCDIARVCLETYYWDCSHVVRPPESIRPVMMVKLATAEYLDCREWRAPRELTLSEAYGKFHHLSWNLPPDYAKRKLDCWGHADEVVKDFLADKFVAFQGNNLLRNLNPQYPPAYDHIERIPKPPILADAWDGNPTHGEPDIVGRLPRTEGIIVLHGGEDIFKLLDSLHPIVRITKAQFLRESGGKSPKTRKKDGPVHLLEGVTVVDNASPDNLADRIIEAYPWVRVIKCSRNVGFSAGNNIAVKACSRSIEAFLFLNSDDIVCRSGLIPMFNTYNSSDSIGVVGAMSNAAGYRQMVHGVTPSQLENLELFCRDFSHRAVEDVETGMVVFFAALARRSLYEQLGGLSEDYYPALWEDTDYSFLVQKSRSRCMISTKSFVFHKGSQSLARMDEPIRVVMGRHEGIYRRKYLDDVESGFASHYAGDANAEPVRFDYSKHPDLIRAEIKRLAPLADCGLSIICGDKSVEITETMCKSVHHVFTQKVAYLNNCNDPERMKTMLASYGFEVLEGNFVDFAHARNLALKPMRTAFVAYLDSDDLLPLMSGLLILRAILGADHGVGAFRLPVQFPYSKGNTRVDHCKIMRNDLRNEDGSPTIQWDYEIHEQWVQCATKRGLRVDPIPNAYVLHLNYETDPEAQKAKRTRDYPYLYRAIETHPNCPFAHWNVGMTLEDDNRLEEALQWLNKSIALSNPATSTLRKAYFVKARALRRMARDADAEATMREGLKVYPDDPELNYALAGLLIDTKRPAEAIPCLNAMQTETSDHYGSIDIGVLGPKRRLMYARAVLDLDRYVEAAAELRALMAEGNLEAATLMYEAAMNRRDLRAGDEALAAVLPMTGPDERWCLARMKLSEAMGLAPEGHLYAMIQGLPGEPAPYLVLSRFHLERGEEARAMPLLQALSSMGVAEGALNMGVIFARRRQFQAALEAYRRALELDPNHEMAKSQIAAFEQAIAANPVEPNVEG